MTPLTIADTSRIHFRGGSTLGISRANPTKDPELLEKTPRRRSNGSASACSSRSAATTPCFTRVLAREGVARALARRARPEDDRQRSRPAARDVYTFGFQTARHIGVEIVKNLMVDAKTTVALVLRRRDGSQGRAPRARHRQGRGRDAHAHPRGVPERTRALSTRRRHARGRDHQAPRVRAHRRRRRPRRGPRRDLAGERSRGARGRRARRARSHPHRRDRLRQTS